MALSVLAIDCAVARARSGFSFARQAAQRILRSRVIAPALLVALSIQRQPAQAAFHFYYISEAFSNADGSVQFVELFTDFGGQEFYNGLTLKSNAHTFTFPTTGPNPTANKQVLLATAGFGTIPGGATPNFIIPSNFFNPASDTLSLFDGVDEKVWTNLPVDGINSLNFDGQYSDGVVDVNSPRNFAGAGSSVDLSSGGSPTGDYNGNNKVDGADYVVWRNTFGAGATPPGSGADGDESGTIGAGDLTFWRAHFGEAVGSGVSLASSAAPEPAAIVLIATALLATHLRRRREH